MHVRGFVFGIACALLMVCSETLHHASSININRPHLEIKRRLVEPSECLTGNTNAQALHLRGGSKASRVVLHRENTMLALRKYFSQLSFPLSKRKPLKANTGFTILGAVRWKGLIAAVIIYAWMMYGWSGKEMQLGGKMVPAAQKCAAIVCFVSILWGTEAVPLHITSLMVPLLTVLTGSLMSSDGVPLSPGKAAKEICGEFFSPTILLFLAGFSISAVLEKQKLSGMLANAVLRPLGGQPSVLLLGMMMLGVFLSMWISNISSAVLCSSLVRPILAQLPPGDPFAKALLLGVAFSNNIGGMTTPIASPQNVVALDWCQPAGSMTFGRWMAFTSPFCATLLMATWGILCALYPPTLKSIPFASATPPAPPPAPSGSPAVAQDKPGGLTVEQGMSILITLGTIGCWSLWGPLGLERVFGAMGIMGLVPVILFFSLGLLDNRDFNSAINWSVLILIGGGLALGHLMERSQLLSVVSVGLQSALKGQNLWTVVAVVSLVMSVFSNFVSSVVAAVITLPVIAQVGKQVGSPAGLVVASTLVSTAAMALPVSSFPNAHCFSVHRPAAPSTDRNAALSAPTPYLEAKDYLVAGGLVTLTALVLMVTLGYGTLRIINF